MAVQRQDNVEDATFLDTLQKFWAMWVFAFGIIYNALKTHFTVKQQTAALSSIDKRLGKIENTVVDLRVAVGVNEKKQGD